MGCVPQTRLYRSQSFVQWDSDNKCWTAHCSMCSVFVLLPSSNDLLSLYSEILFTVFIFQISGSCWYQVGDINSLLQSLRWILGLIRPLPLICKINTVKCCNEGEGLWRALVNTVMNVRFPRNATWLAK
jgi:hypothetical protein